MNSLLRLIEHGQSYWMDDLTRPMIRSDELERRVREEGLRGITSNPKIFATAISKSDAYDDQIRALVAEGRSVQATYEALVVTDIQDACDVLRPVYEESDGTDGFVSLEVSPYLAHDTEGTLDEARRLSAAVDRENLLIKVPGTAAGVPAIEELLFEGINVNVTLLFSTDAYEEVARAYIRALERRAEADRPIDGIASVASFFLSRIDVLVDQLLSHRLTAGGRGSVPPALLLGRAAVANAKMAYRRFQRIFGDDRWRALAEQGGRVQRVLWASTSTKDPLYSDVKYVEPLIGPHTVNTMPGATIAAFADHGTVRTTVEEGMDRAERDLEDLASLGVDMDQVTAQLLHEGVQKFIDPFDTLIAQLADARRRFLGREACRERVAVGGLDDADASGLESLDRRQFGRRIFRKNPQLWTSDRERAEAIVNRLGWLDSVEDFRDRSAEIRDFAAGIRDAGIRDVVLLGMGGSSLCPEVCRQVFGSREGWPRLTMLDNTDPAAVRAVDAVIDPRTSLFLVASKSGTTRETLSFYRYFYRRVKEAGVGNPGERFVAITDPGTPLVAEAGARGFRRVFQNPADIGGRYSALSYFGLVPMALIGIDIDGILSAAHQMRCSCGPLIPANANPGVRIGALLGVGGLEERDKVTFAFSDSLAPFGQWVEQLLAESTGKDGRGLLPVADEPPGRPEAYDDDRLFVQLRLAGEDTPYDDDLDALEEAGHPVLRIELEDRIGLGAEFFRWELATAAAGSVIGINPFDEPNVAESKTNTADLLESRGRDGHLPDSEPVLTDGALAVHVDPDAPWRDELGSRSVREALRAFTDMARPGDYVALLAYLRRTADRHDALQALRRGIRDRLRVATTLGYGPRYLHSTGQLHKGGPNTGLFVLITTDSDGEIEIPGAGYGFATLQRAQALGDQRALMDKGRRVLRLHVSGDVDDALARLAEHAG